MIIVSLLCLSWNDTWTYAMLSPGYYDVVLIGGTGGSLDRDVYGGPGAHFYGVLNVTEDAEYYK